MSENSGLGQRGLLARFGRDKRGNVMAMTAAAAIPMIGVVGGAIDASRMYMVRSKLQAACDSAVLAGRKSMTNGQFPVNGTADQRARAMFNFNFKNSDFQTTATAFNATADASGRLNGTATTTLPMTMMKMFGFTEQVQSVSCSADIQIPNIDIVFVLDVTGSMSGYIGSSYTTRISALKAAAKNFYTTLSNQMTANGTNAGRVRYGFVPYSQTVNVKDLFKATPDTAAGEAALTNIADTMTVESRVANFTASASNNYIPDTTPGKVTTSILQTFDNDRWRSKQPYEAVDDSDQTDLKNSECNEYVANDDFSYGNGGGTAVNLVPDGPVLYIPEGSTTAQTSVPSTNTYRQLNFSRYSPTNERNNTRGICTRRVTTTHWIKQTSYKFANWTYKPVTINVASFKAGTALRYVTDVDSSYTVSGAASYDPVQLAGLSNQTGLTSTTTTWNGCIEERDTVATNSFSPIPITAYDLNSLVAGTSSQTKWRPVIHRLTYDRQRQAQVTTTGDFDQPGTACPAARIKNLNVISTQAAFDAYIDTLTPGGMTYLDLGMVWGLRLIHPQGMFGYRNLVGPNGGQISRHIIFITDGDPADDGATYSGYGVERMSKRITGTTGQQAASLHALRFQALCDSHRGTINIWAIAIDTSVNANLSSCADPGRAYEASNTTQLNAAFTNIASTIADLRLVQ